MIPVIAILMLLGPSASMREQYMRNWASAKPLTVLPPVATILRIGTRWPGKPVAVIMLVEYTNSLWWFPCVR